ncbi:MAG: pyridoxal phosphate-dependent aminotransferase [Chloroflexota bacterium]
MRYRRMPIEAESPEQLGYGRIRFNLAESSVSDASLGDLAEGLGGLVLQYGDHLGLPDLRDAIAADAPGVPADGVMVTPGAVAALFILHTSLLEAGSHAVIARPNYATNVETPRAIGADVSFLDLAFEDGWRVDPERIEALMTPQTRLVSLTTPHNPTGTTLDRSTLDAVIGIVERRGAKLLIDETYREMTFGDMLPVAASLSPAVVSVSSLSKTYGLPGIRIGWLATQDLDLRDRLLAAKEQILISGSLVDETIALGALRRRPAWLPAIRARIDEAFGITAAWLRGHEMLEWVEPRGGVVGFPRIRSGAGVDTDAFYRSLFDDHGTIVGPGHWFEQPREHFRLGYGWPTIDELRGGLAAIDAALASARA